MAPLIQTKWGQLNASGGYCYNYYTPNHYYAGCVATALAQLLRFHQHPTDGVGTPSFSIEVDGVPQTASLRGGDGAGGPYVWGEMVPVPADGLTETQRQAIGALLYDAGVSVSMNYTSGGSGTDGLLTANALRNTFGYANAVRGYNGGGEIGDGIVNMVNPNLDAGLPVILGIAGPDRGHLIVSDGYGYDSGTLYHHMNMGWSGNSDVWYDLPDFSEIGHDVVRKCVYNVFVSGGGEIVSGRVFNGDGTPLAGVFVTAQTAGGDAYQVATNSNGIYAFVHLPSNQTYTVNIDCSTYTGLPLTLTTGQSVDHAPAAGNRWGCDFMVCGPVPFAFDANVNVAVDSPTEIEFQACDDGLPNPPGALTYLVVSLPRHGYLEEPGVGMIDHVAYYLAGGRRRVVYHPDPGYMGTDVFSFRAKDGGDAPNGGMSGWAGVHITVKHRVLFVDDNGYTGAAANSWDKATRYLQDAIEIARNSNGFFNEIRVAQGVYRPDDGGGHASDNRQASFELLPGVTVRGGYAGKGQPDPDARDPNAFPTILSGDLRDNDDGFDHNGENSYHVITATGVDGTTVLDGFTVRGGNANASAMPRDAGGGMRNDHGSPTISNCLFTFNFAKWGGAAENYAASNATFLNCRFVSNHSGQLGGAVNINASRPRLVGCAFEANRGGTGAGALMCGHEGGYSLLDCTFLSNTTDVGGGGAIHNNASGPSTAINCSFVANVAAVNGGAVDSYRSTMSLANCMIKANRVGGIEGGAIWNVGGSNLTLVNCTICGNEVNGAGAGVVNGSSNSVRVSNCILWGNKDEAGSGEASQLRSTAGAPIVNYNCIQGWSGAFGGVGNIGNDPLFVDPVGPDGVAGTADDDLTLSARSPCADAGGNGDVPIDAEDIDSDGDTGEPLPLDLRRQPRFADSLWVYDVGSGTPPIVDIGCYEFQMPNVLSDLDSDGDVDQSDYGLMQRCLGGAGVSAIPVACYLADLDYDADVDQADLGLLVGCLTGSGLPADPDCGR